LFKNQIVTSESLPTFAKIFLANTQNNFLMPQTGKFSTLLQVIVFALSSIVFQTSAFASEEEGFNVNEMIMHHIKDAHEWHIAGPEHGGISVYLPVILHDNGFKVFSSKYFYHGNETVVTEKDGAKHTYMEGVGPAKGYGLYHEEIYKLDNVGTYHGNPVYALEFHGEHPSSATVTDLSITKNVASLIMGSFLILLIMFSVARFYRKNGAVAPKGIAKFLEPIIVMVRDDIAKANIDHHKYHKYVPYLLTVFFFIWINNMLGLIPIIPGGANLTGNITITFFLAFCTLLVTVFSGNKNYWGHIFWMPGIPVPMKIFMIPIELIGVLTKPFALMVRLFANISAGHIIVLALISIIFINKNYAWAGLSVPMALFISVLEILVAFLQGFLFAMLSALFIGAAVEEAHH
jgi:F-type H+-transporting ATPase subunit a